MPGRAKSDSDRFAPRLFSSKHPTTCDTWPARNSRASRPDRRSTISSRPRATKVHEPFRSAPTTTCPAVVIGSGSCAKNGSQRRNVRAFVDTSTLLALSHTRDQYHPRARAAARRCRAAGGRFVSSTLVLGEFHSHLLYQRGPVAGSCRAGAPAGGGYQRMDGRRAATGNGNQTR